LAWPMADAYEKFINASPAHKSGPPTDTASSLQSHGCLAANTDEQHRPHQGPLDTIEGGSCHSSDGIQAPAEATSVSENSLHLEAPRISRSPCAVDDATTIGRISHSLLVAAASPSIPHASSSHTSPQELPIGWTLPPLRGDSTPHHPTPAPGDSLSEAGPPIQYHFSSYERPEPDLRVDEIALLRHYRYSIAPWLDLGDLDQPFGVLMLRATAGCQKLHRAILALSARHQELLRGHRRRFHITENTSSWNPAHLNTESASESTALASFVILDLVDYLSGTPQDWRAVVVRGVLMLLDIGPSSLGSGISKALFWLWLRLGRPLRSSLTTQKSSTSSLAARSCSGRGFGTTTTYVIGASGLDVSPSPFTQRRFSTYDLPPNLRIARRIRLSIAATIFSTQYTRRPSIVALTKSLPSRSMEVCLERKPEVV
jgi:hypothetical protein